MCVVAIARGFDKAHEPPDFPGFLFRVLPASGRVYISTNYLCFRSNSPLTRTRASVHSVFIDLHSLTYYQMMIPIRDILSTEKTKPFRFGQYGLVIVIRGFEELFFEFSGADKRNACVDLLNAQMDDVQKRIALDGTAPAPPTPGRREALILDELEHIGPSAGSDSEADEPDPYHEHGHEQKGGGYLGASRSASASESIPPTMFTSTSSSFLTFKPSHPLRFTFLTIGSRGDVQPYIALGKGLLADGHRVKIATHGEFREWIESVGVHCPVTCVPLTAFNSTGWNTATLAGTQPSLCACVSRTAPSLFHS